MPNGESRGFWQSLGPGLLFAAAAVGVSHLVQSTRAGAVYGLGMIGLVLFANLMKYPAFRFGPYYATATGTSLLEGYRRQGNWALAVYGVLTLGTMFTVQAAVTVVTAGLLIATLGIDDTPWLKPPIFVSAILLAISAAILAIGKYRLLDRVTKGLVAVLTVSTLAATVLALPRVNFGDSFFLSPSAYDKTTIFFAAALVGWMPSAIDVAVWQSLWTLARRDDTGHTPSMRESSLDFHIGYVGTALLALCFLFMGAGVMHGTGSTFSEPAGAFAAQVIGLYTSTLGAWSRPIIAVAAFAVMFSTTLTVLDGFPRALAVLFQRFRQPEDPKLFELDAPLARRIYWMSMAGLALGSLLVLQLLLTSLKTMVDVATTMSFLTAPVLSVLNHRAVTGGDVPKDKQPKRWLVLSSLIGIVLQAAFALYYLSIRYG